MLRTCQTCGQAFRPVFKIIYTENGIPRKLGHRRYCSSICASPQYRAPINSRNYRSRKAGAQGRHTTADLRAIFALQKGKCAYCRATLSASHHADHIQPLAKGGSNHRSNIQLLCKQCNVAKGSKDPIDHARSLGLLL